MCLSCTRYLAIGPCLALLGRALRAPSHCTLKYHTCCGIVGEVAPQHVWGCWVAHVLSPTWISRKDHAGAAERNLSIENFYLRTLFSMTSCADPCILLGELPRTHTQY